VAGKKFLIRLSNVIPASYRSIHWLKNNLVAGRNKNKKRTIQCLHNIVVPNIQFYIVDALSVSGILAFLADEQVTTMADITDKRTGALHSELKIELHTHYATGLWLGRRAERAEDGKKAKPSIMGMPRFLSLASRINLDSLKNNPWADAAMLELEEKITLANQKMKQLIDDLESVMQWLPKGATLSEALVSEPLDIQVYSNTPLGYRCVFLLLGFDQFAKQVLQASHYGLISRTQRYDMLSAGSRLIREIYGSVMRYRSLPISRQDIIENNDTWRQAIEELGEPERDVLLGNRRSVFSPPVNQASVDLLRIRYLTSQRS
jgi:integrating conjugative element protein (TIGR03761 family)